MPAIAQPFGSKTRYFLHPETLALFQHQRQAPPPQSIPTQEAPKNLKALLPDWCRAMEKGLIKGKPFSARTSANYRYYVEPYFERHDSLNIEEFRAALAKIPPERFATREHFYRAIRSFAAYLNHNQAGSGCSAFFLKESAPLKPKRHLPPKRQTVTEAGLAALLQVCETPYDRALIMILSQTGIRASECCALNVGDLDWEEGVLNIRRGKGGKRRCLGLSDTLLEGMRDYWDSLASGDSRLDVALPPLVSGNKGGKGGHRASNPSNPLFQDRNGKRLSSSGLYQRLERIGRKAGARFRPMP